MKDYYYVLGLTPDATEAQIRNAFKQLSVRFHPDMNGGDKFFEEHFKEIQEAYEVLNDAQRKEAYDRKMGFYQGQTPVQPPEEEVEQEPIKPQTPPQTPQFSAPPVIHALSCSKLQAQDGDLITLTWRVANADYLHLSLVGEVNLVGTKTLRLPKFNGKELLVLTLLARNTQLNQTVERQIIIQNKTIQGQGSRPQAQSVQTKQLGSGAQVARPTWDEDEEEEQRPKKNKNKRPGREYGYTDKDVYAYFLIFMLVMLILVLGYTVIKLNSQT
jgi:hypothetical protein